MSLGQFFQKHCFMMCIAYYYASNIIWTQSCLCNYIVVYFLTPLQAFLLQPVVGSIQSSFVFIIVINSSDYRISIEKITNGLCIKWLELDTFPNEKKTGYIIISTLVYFLTVLKAVILIPAPTVLEIAR